MKIGGLVGLASGLHYKEVLTIHSYCQYNRNDSSHNCKTTILSITEITNVKHL